MYFKSTPGVNMRTRTFMALFLLGLFLGSLHAVENIKCTASSPLFSSYLAPYERSDYFVDEGYHLVYYRDHEPVKLVNDSSGEIVLAFKLGEVLAYDVGDFYRKPTVTVSYPDSFVLEAEPFMGLKITLRFALYRSDTALLELEYKNETRLALLLYVVYGNAYQKVRVGDVDPEGRLTVAYREPGDRVYFQQKALKGFKEERQAAFRFNQPLYSWGGYPAYKELKQDNLIGKNAFLNGSVGGELAAVAINFKMPQKYGTFRLAKAVVQPGIKDRLEELLTGAMKLSFAEILKFNRQRLKHIPGLTFRDEEERLLFYAGLYLARQQFYPAAGQFPHAYYVFSREPTWGWGHEGQVFHESLAMHSLALFDPQLAIGSQRNFMAVQGKDGYMPYRVGAYFTRTFPAGGEKTTSAPFYCWTNLEVYRLAKGSGLVGAKELDRYLRESYDSGKRFVDYLWRTRDKNGNGLLEWGGHTLLECVRDYLNAVFDLLGKAPETLNQLEALDLSSMVVKEMRSLQEMARLLGLDKEAKLWEKKIEKLSALINQYMWDEETGFYYHVHTKTMNFRTPAGTSLKRKEIIGFLPLWAGVADSKQREKLLGHLRNPDEFWRPYGIPTLSAADPYYDPQVLGCCRWNGPVWITWVYPVFRGLLDCGRKDAAGAVLDKMEEAMLFQLRRNHRLWESYSPDFTQLDSPKNYIWDALISRMIHDIRK